jgi:hypothetical protein
MRFHFSLRCHTRSLHTERFEGPPRQVSPASQSRLSSIPISATRTPHNGPTCVTTPFWPISYLFIQSHPGSASLRAALRDPHRPRSSRLLLRHASAAYRQYCPLPLPPSARDKARWGQGQGQGPRETATETGSLMCYW